MKKIIALILASLMLFSVFAGCNVNASTRNSSSSEDSFYEEVSSNSSEAAANSSSNPTVNSNSASSNVTSSETITSSSSEDANINESAKQEEMQGSQTTTSGFSYEDYRVVTSEYNRNLFYYNELLFEVADPTVIYISDKNSTEYGYFYAYGTSDQIGCVGFQGWRSKDLTNWEDMGPVYLPDFNNCWAYTNYWAPEIVYDETGMVINGETYNYFMFFNAEKYDASQDFVSGTNRSTSQHISVMYAKEPYGPFYLPNNICQI